MLGVSKEGGKRRKGVKGEGVNQKVGRGDGKLNEADALLVGVQAVGLGVHSDEGFGGEFVGQGTELRGAGDEVGGKEVCGRHEGIIAPL